MEPINYLNKTSSLKKKYWSIALPAALGLLIVLLSSVDLMMISSLGTEAVAAVSIFSQPKMVILCFSRSLAVVATALIALRVGQGQKEECASIMRPIIVVTVIGAGALLALSLIFIKEILLLAGAENTYLAPAISYGQIVSVSLFFYGLAIVLNGGLTGMGKTMPMLLANVAGNGVNVLLNALFIYYLKLEVLGAGLATLIGSVVTLGITIGFMQKGMQLFNLKHKKEWIPTKGYLKELWGIVAGVFAEQGFERIGMFLYSRLVAQLGMIAFAAHNICMTLCDIYYNVGQGLSKASLALAGQYKGKGDYKEMKNFIRFAQKSGLYLSLLVALIYMFFRSPLMGLYSQVPEVLNLGTYILIIVAICCIPQTQSLIASGILRGVGYTAYVAKYSLWSIAIIRPIITWILCFVCGLGLYGAWYALILDQTMRMTCAVWKVKRLEITQ